jgi:N-methylhydantoinase A
LDEDGVKVLALTLEELYEKAVEWFDVEKAPQDGRGVELLVDARYVGQNFELAVPVASGAFLKASDVPNTTNMHAAFCKAHDLAYGYSSDTDPIEIVNVRLSARARLHQLEDRPAVSKDPVAPTPRDQRDVYFEVGAPVKAQIYDRAEMIPGQCINGPAIIEQMDTTTLVYPGDITEITPDGHLIIKIDVEAKL